ncbi:hypothetical protein C366_02960, partial [Cryptococcus neoformans Tu401-1]
MGCLFIVNTSLSFPVELISPKELLVTSQQLSSTTAIILPPRPPHPSHAANATSLRRAPWTRKWSHYNLRGPLSIGLTGWPSVWLKTIRFLFRIFNKSTRYPNTNHWFAQDI